MKIERTRIHFSSGVFASVDRRPRILTSLKLSTRTWLCVLHTVLGQCAKKVSDDLRGKIYL